MLPVEGAEARPFGSGQAPRPTCTNQSAHPSWGRRSEAEIPTLAAARMGHPQDLPRITKGVAPAPRRALFDCASLGWAPFDSAQDGPFGKLGVNRASAAGSHGRQVARMRCGCFRGWLRWVEELAGAQSHGRWRPSRQGRDAESAKAASTSEELAGAQSVSSLRD